MLTRRHIRVKVMQCLYALLHTKNGSLEDQEKFLKQSIGQTYTLYLLTLAFFRELHEMAVSQLKKGEKKYLKTENTEEVTPHFLSENKVLKWFSSNPELTEALEKRKLKQWYLHEDYVKQVYRQILESDKYKEYASKAGDWESDKKFTIEIFKNFIAPNDKIYEFLEDETITWVDDIPLVNTFIVKRLSKIGSDTAWSFALPQLIKNKEDMDFAMLLLQKTLQHSDFLDKEVGSKTLNWDKDRIAEVDSILLKMGIAELLYFPSIPERVTINEYLEIAKEYSTPKSSVFINGILDNVIREYRDSGKLKKTGRGLL
jgi:N utilization substance protein B